MAMWMTNRERHWRFAEAQLLPAWGLARCATWLWLKVTDDGRPVSQLVRVLWLCDSNCCPGSVRLHSCAGPLSNVPRACPSVRSKRQATAQRVATDLVLSGLSQHRCNADRFSRRNLRLAEGGCRSDFVLPTGQ